MPLQSLPSCEVLNNSERMVWAHPGPCQHCSELLAQLPQGCPSPHSHPGAGACGVALCSLLLGWTPLHPSTGCKEEAGLHPGTAEGQEALLDPQPCGTAPSEADQREPEPCAVTTGNRKRKATSVPEEGNGSRASAGGPQSPAGDGDQLASGSRESCEPSSAMPSTAGSDRSSGAPAADETVHSLGTPTCCSSGASTCQSTPLDSSDGRERGSSPPGSPQPGASTADVLQIPSGCKADPRPGPISQLVDGATTSPVPTALLTNGTAVSPIPTVPLISEEGRSDSSAPLTMEEARMLVELFYLPYHHGPQAQHLLEDLQWLRANSPNMGVPTRSPNSCVVRLIWVLLWERAHCSCSDTCSVCRLHSGAVGPAPSSSSVPRRAACTAASSTVRGRRCSTTSTPTCGTSATCCWLPAPLCCGWVREGGHPGGQFSALGLLPTPGQTQPGSQRAPGQSRTASAP